MARPASACIRDLNRRLLLEQEAAENTIHVNCWSAPEECLKTKYSLSYLASGHLYLLAQPMSMSTSLPSLDDEHDSKKSKSEVMACTEVYLFDNGPSGKQVTVGPTRDVLLDVIVDGIPDHDHNHHESLLLLKEDIPLGEIQGAFALSRCMDQSNFDILDNNCGTFVLDMMKAMSVDYTSDKLVGYTVAMQAQSEHVLQMVREHPDAEAVLGLNEEEMGNDAIVVASLFDYYVHTH